MYMAPPHLNVKLYIKWIKTAARLGSRVAKDQVGMILRSDHAGLI